MKRRTKDKSSRAIALKPFMLYFALILIKIIFIRWQYNRRVGRPNQWSEIMLVYHILNLLYSNHRLRIPAQNPFDPTSSRKHEIDEKKIFSDQDSDRYIQIALGVECMFAGWKKFQALNSDDQTYSWFIKARKDILMELVHIIKQGQFSIVILCLFTLRQDFTTDVLGGFHSATTLLLMIEVFLKSELPNIQIFIDPIMIEDIQANKLNGGGHIKEIGDTFKLILQQRYYDSIKKKFDALDYTDKHVTIFNDTTKTCLFYLLMHRPYNNFPKAKQIYFIFVDDEAKILQQHYDFAFQQSYLFAKSIICYVQYDGDGIKNKRHLILDAKVAGKKDPHYIWTTRFLHLATMNYFRCLTPHKPSCPEKGLTTCKQIEDEHNLFVCNTTRRGWDADFLMSPEYVKQNIYPIIRQEIPKLPPVFSKSNYTNLKSLMEENSDLKVASLLGIPIDGIPRREDPGTRIYSFPFVPISAEDAMAIHNIKEHYAELLDDKLKIEKLLQKDIEQKWRQRLQRILYRIDVKIMYFFDYLKNPKQTELKIPRNPPNLLRNSAVKHFIGQDSKRDLRLFQEGYSCDAIQSLIFCEPQQSNWYRAVFAAPPDSEQKSIKFFKQFRSLWSLHRLLKLRGGVRFICFSPVEFNTSHFNYIMVWDDTLLLIDPLGKDLSPAVAQELVELKKLCDLKSIFVSSTQIQKENNTNITNGIASSGPICVEIMWRLEEFDAKAIHQELSECTAIPQKSFSVDLVYKTFDLAQTKLLPQSLRSIAAETDITKYQKQMLQLRQIHLKNLQLSNPQKHYFYEQNVWLWFCNEIFNDDNDTKLNLNHDVPDERKMQALFKLPEFQKLQKIFSKQSPTPQSDLVKSSLMTTTQKSQEKKTGEDKRLPALKIKKTNLVPG